MLKEYRYPAEPSAPPPEPAGNQIGLWNEFFRVFHSQFGRDISAAQFSYAACHFCHSTCDKVGDGS